MNDNGELTTYAVLSNSKVRGTRTHCLACFLSQRLSRGSNSRAGEDDLTATMAIALRAFLRHQDHCRACDTGTAVFEQQRQRQHGKMTMHDMPSYSVKQCSNVQGGPP